MGFFNSLHVLRPLQKSVSKCNISKDVVKCAEVEVRTESGKVGFFIIGGKISEYQGYEERMPSCHVDMTWWRHAVDMTCLPAQ